MVYSDSTPCVVTVQNVEVQTKSTERERDRRPFAQRSAFLARVCPELSSLFVPGKPSSSPGSSRSPLSVVLLFEPVFRRRARTEAFPERRRPRSGIVRWSGAVTTTSMGNDPACCRPRYARRHGTCMRATLRNRVGDRRAQAIFVEQGRRLHLPSDLPSQNKATRTYKRKEERSSMYTANANARQGRINRSITLGLLVRSTRGETPAIASNPELLGP